MNNNGAGVSEEAASRQVGPDETQSRHANLAAAAATLAQVAPSFAGGGTSASDGAVSKEAEDSRGKKRRPPALSLAQTPP